MSTIPTLAPGTVIRNGMDALTSHDAPWGSELTIVARDMQTYGNVRYVVRDATGRRSYALALYTY